MNFNSAFDATLNTLKNIVNYVRGENGALAHSSLNPSTIQYQDLNLDSIPFNLDSDKQEKFDNSLIELFLLVRDDNSLTDKLEQIYSFIDSTTSIDEKKVYFERFIKTVLFIRQPRQGKGERKLFIDTIKYFWIRNQEVAKFIISLIPEFGCWDDINHLYDLNYIELNKYLIQMMADAIKEDYTKIQEDQNAKISLVGKWAPREKSVYDYFAHDLASYISAGVNKNSAMKRYRQMVASLNKHLKTVQHNMCQKKWAEIDFNNVPSVSMTQLTKAFQHEKTNPYPKSKRPPSKYNNKFVGKFVGRRHDETHIDYQDRDTCRNNLLNFINSGNKVKSSVTNLSFIIEKYLRGSEADMVWESQWTSRVEELRILLNSVENNMTIFPMVDLSSSMSGNPMIQAITLGLFTSMFMDKTPEGEENQFANRFMSFNTTPQLVKLPRTGTLKEKMEVMKKWTDPGFWGGTTNIQKAIQLLLEIAVSNNLPKEEMPKVLAIFSDMQFDAGDSTWNETSYEMIKRQFETTGYEIPHIIFWNLRENTQGYQVLTNRPNSTMLSGFSTRMMDLFLQGNLDELKTDTNVPEEVKQNKTTKELFDKALNHAMFESHNEQIKTTLDKLIK
jgi:hypothetical protein